MVLRPRCDKSFQRVGEQDWVLDTRRGWKTCAPKLHRAQRTRDMAVVNRVIDGLHDCDLVVLRVVVAPDGYTVGRQPLAIAPQREDIHSARCSASAHGRRKMPTPVVCNVDTAAEPHGLVSPHILEELDEPGGTPGPSDQPIVQADG